jgi:hypothetical protein
MVKEIGIMKENNDTFGKYTENELENGGTHHGSPSVVDALPGSPGTYEKTRHVETTLNDTSGKETGNELRNRGTHHDGRPSSDALPSHSGRSETTGHSDRHHTSHHNSTERNTGMSREEATRVGNSIRQVLTERAAQNQGQQGDQPHGTQAVPEAPLNASTHTREQASTSDPIRERDHDPVLNAQERDGRRIRGASYPRISDNP